jgi:hypothetical protein
MAKNQSYYFSHDINASNDPKIAAMISELGMISYAWWWILIEKLAAADDYKLPLKKYTFVALDNELKMNGEQILTSVQQKSTRVGTKFNVFILFIFVNLFVDS